MEGVKRLVIIAAILAMAIGSEARFFAGKKAFCNMTEEGLNACKPSVSGQSPVPPTPECCSALKAADFGCLCKYKDNTMLMNIYGINPDLAMQLPTQCDFAQTIHC